MHGCPADITIGFESLAKTFLNIPPSKGEIEGCTRTLTVQEINGVVSCTNFLEFSNRFVDFWSDGVRIFAVIANITTPLFPSLLRLSFTHT